MNLWAIAAAALTAVTGLIHVFWGGRDIARPLLASQELAFEPKMTAYYCWHMATIVIFGIAIAYLYAGVVTSAQELAIAATGLAGAFAVLSVALVVWTRCSPLTLPQWALFCPIAVLGALAAN